MKVFISCSGEKSYRVGAVLKKWLSKHIQAVRPFISSDLDKGTNWPLKLSEELENTKFGIICLDRTNLKSEWINFEAGALSKIRDSNVCTFLLDITPGDVKPPLGHFQGTQFIKEDIFRLLSLINSEVKKLNTHGVSDGDLRELFDDNWNKLEVELKDILKNEISPDTKVRTDRDLLEELLQIVRSQNNQMNLRPSNIEMQNSLPDDNYYIEIKGLKNTLQNRKVIQDFISLNLKDYGCRFIDKFDYINFLLIVRSITELKYFMGQLMNHWAGAVATPVNPLFKPEDLINS